MSLLTTLFSSSCRTKSGTLDSWFWVTFLCLTVSSSLEASICTEEANTLGCTANLNNLLVISKRLVNISNTTLQQFKKVTKDYRIIPGCCNRHKYEPVAKNPDFNHMTMGMLQQFFTLTTKVFHCALDHGLAEDPGNEPMIKKACMKESCYSGKKSDHQINHDPQTFTSCRDTIYAILKSYLTDIQDLFPDLLNAVNDIMQALNDSHIQVQPLSSSQHPLNEKYDVHMKKCSSLLILQQLSQTIHRSLSYLISLKK